MTPTRATALAALATLAARPHGRRIPPLFTADLNTFRRRLFAGDTFNLTEHRATMHMALRSPATAGLRAALIARFRAPRETA